MPKETITLSHRELDRVSVIESIIAKRRRQHEAVGKVGGAGCGGPGLCASNEHTETLSEVGDGVNTIYMIY